MYYEDQLYKESDEKSFGLSTTFYSSKKPYLGASFAFSVSVIAKP